MTSLTAIFVTFLAQCQVFLLCFGAIRLYNGAGILDVISTNTFEKFKFEILPFISISYKPITWFNLCLVETLLNVE